MAILGFFLDLCYKSMVWGLAIIGLPLRLFTALYREIIKLEQQLREMKARLDSLACENKQLGQFLQVALSGSLLQDEAVIRRLQQRGGGRREEKWLFPGPDEEHKAVAIRRSLSAWRCQSWWG
ncbi:hypothetical protein KSP39_PZI006335 [Platanthera zijinensis]|uniref:Uncharacterized protein n=1 Tax=Platanthera zijinensis TaxID=2320716 RepID=A0AAP0BUN1_9ASPA